MTKSNDTGRISFFAYLFFYPRIASRISVALLAAVLQSPAFFSSCATTKEEKEESSVLRTKAQIYIQWSENPTPDALDVFFFFQEEPRHLDAYQQITEWDQGRTVYALSGNGDRHLVALSGTAGDIYSWTDIQTYGSLGKLLFSLEDENPARPRLIGEADLDQAQSRQTYLTLHPMLCAIRIRSVACDFSKRPYADLPFINNKLYVLNAGWECLPVGDTGGGPVSWMNQGRLDSAAVFRLPRPEMLLQEGCGAIGKARVSPDRTFYCYANPATEDGLGASVTRMVLEGSIGGITCYYPISLPGMTPGTCYELDLTLTKMGSPDPDIPVESGTVIVEAGSVPWESREPETLTF